MEAKLQKWGNSFGIRIPSGIVKSLNMKENDIFELKEGEDKIIMSKKKINLKQMFKEYDGPNRSKDFEWVQSN